MSWFILALVPPFLWGIVNHVDKYLLSKYIKSGIGGLMLFSTLFAAIVAPILLLINPAVLDLSSVSIFAFMVAGVLYAVTIFLYMHALAKDEASVVVPFFLLVPPFTYILGYFLLGETLGFGQIFAALIIILGSLILSLEIGEDNKFRIRKGVSILMFFSSLSIALQAVLFKYFALDESFIVSSFWVYVGLFIFGIFLFLIPHYRKDFFSLLKNSGAAIMTVNLVSETLTIVGNLAYSFATLLVPVVFVSLIYPFQPAFVFIIGIILTVFFPHIAEEKISLKHLVHKFTAIAVMFVGTYLLYF